MIVPVGDWLIVVLNRSVANIVSSLVISEVGAMWSADNSSYSTYFKLYFFHLQWSSFRRVWLVATIAKLLLTDLLTDH